MIKEFKKNFKSKIQLPKKDKDVKTTAQSEQQLVENLADLSWSWAFVAARFCNLFRAL